jgi:hypothetical protein
LTSQAFLQEVMEQSRRKPAGKQPQPTGDQQQQQQLEPPALFPLQEFFVNKVIVLIPMQCQSLQAMLHINLHQQHLRLHLHQQE